MKDTFYITTPIYYSNWIPHIWHAYSSIIADVISRYMKISWKKVKFSTWVDENSQKAVLKAEEHWMKTIDYLNMMAKKHKAVWDWLDIKYTDFIRTTEKRHHELVKKVLQKSFDNWDIYEWEYEWMYCVWCESFKKEDDLVYLNKTTNKKFSITKDVVESDNIIKVCPDHLKTPDKIKEKNYFFKLSKYENFLKEFYNSKEWKNFVIPSDRFNEVKSFVDRWLEDFSISRETNKFWIKLPFDETQVTYVWYDALFNYVTVCTKTHPTTLLQEREQDQDDMDFWPCDLHVVGKDIIKFHAIYWPAMLKSAWYELPKNILTTWFFTIDWHKISKSLWNVIDPVEFSNKYSKDLLILYLLSSFHIWQDWDFDQKQAILTYNSKLANNFGNLVNRVIVLTLKLDLKDWLTWKIDNEINNKMNKYLLNFNNKIKEYNLKDILDESFQFLDDLNKYVDQKQPWVSIKDLEKKEQNIDVLYTLAEWLRIVWLVFYMFFPKKIWEMFTKIWLDWYVEKLESWKLEELIKKRVIFKIKQKGDILFNRIELE